ncbi:MAG: preprotein translocase subunit SecE [Bacteroidia bacterium]|nr:preprotein translocase subunit SecE [Bacteroidia bacterium]
MKQKIIDFLNGVTKEMKKVTWPTQEELKESTVVVLVSTLIVGMFISLVDVVFTKLMETLLGS